MKTPPDILAVILLFARVAGEKIYSRTNADLTFIPRDIPNDVTAVDLHGNDFHVIEKNSFLHLASCVTLILAFNWISTIENGAFTGLVSLEILNLDRNYISRLEAGQLAGLFSLKHLTLFGNRISTLDGTTFTNLPRPLRLQLTLNPLECNKDLCWLKEEFEAGTIFWEAVNEPSCGPVKFIEISKSWKHWNCGDGSTKMVIICCSLGGVVVLLVICYVICRRRRNQRRNRHYRGGSLTTASAPSQPLHAPSSPADTPSYPDPTPPSAPPPSYSDLPSTPPSPPETSPPPPTPPPAYDSLHFGDK